MTADKTTAWTRIHTIATRRTHRCSFSTLGALTAIALAVLLVLINTAPFFRVMIALPVLVGLAGWHAVNLLIGRYPVRSCERTLLEGDGSRLRAAGASLVIRVPLAIVSGFVSLLISVLFLGVFGIDIKVTNVTPVAGAFAALLVVGAYIRAVPHSTTSGVAAEEPAQRLPMRVLVRRTVSTFAVLGALTAALIVARSLEPSHVDQYTLISFTDSEMVRPDALTAAPGGPVTLKWTLRSYGLSLPNADADPDVLVSVGSETLQDNEVRLKLTDGAATASGSKQFGSASFDAPLTPGLYKVELVVKSGGSPALLVAYLKVAS